MRREWIEMTMQIALHVKNCCLPPCGGSGLKFPSQNPLASDSLSPSMRREWIEIPCRTVQGSCRMWSPSMRREWIEMMNLPALLPLQAMSPSMRREWIEISVTARHTVSFKSPSMRREWIEIQMQNQKFL